MDQSAKQADRLQLIFDGIEVVCFSAYETLVEITNPRQAFVLLCLRWH